MLSIVEKLRRQRVRQVDPERQRYEFINPDGPEAADIIEAMHSALAAIVSNADQQTVNALGERWALAVDALSQVKP